MTSATVPFRGLAPEDEKTTRVVTVRMTKSQHERLKNEAHDARTSINRLCIERIFETGLPPLHEAPVPANRSRTLTHKLEGDDGGLVRRIVLVSKRCRQTVSGLNTAVFASSNLAPFLTLVRRKKRPKDTHGSSRTWYARVPRH